MADVNAVREETANALAIAGKDEDDLKDNILEDPKKDFGDRWQVVDQFLIHSSSDKSLLGQIGTMRTQLQNDKSNSSLRLGQAGALEIFDKNALRNRIVADDLFDVLLQSQNEILQSVADSRKMGATQEDWRKDITAKEAEIKIALIDLAANKVGASKRLNEHFAAYSQMLQQLAGEVSSDHLFIQQMREKRNAFNREVAFKYSAESAALNKADNFISALEIELSGQTILLAEMRGHLHEFVQTQLAHDKIYSSWAFSGNLKKSESWNLVAKAVESLATASESLMDNSKTLQELENKKASFGRQIAALNGQLENHQKDFQDSTKRVVELAPQVEELQRKLTSQRIATQAVNKEIIELDGIVKKGSWGYLAAEAQLPTLRQAYDDALNSEAVYSSQLKVDKLFLADARAAAGNASQQKHETNQAISTKQQELDVVLQKLAILKESFPGQIKGYLDQVENYRSIYTQNHKLLSTIALFRTNTTLEDFTGALRAGKMSSSDVLSCRESLLTWVEEIQKQSLENSQRSTKKVNELIELRKQELLALTSQPE